MGGKIHCETHGECEETFVCTHLLGESVGLGFNRDEPTADNPLPDAWCDNCELIRAAHGDWSDDAQKLLKVSLLCSVCYERARIRNTRPDITLDNLADLRWKCGACEEWHTGPCLDFSYDSPQYWLDKHEEFHRKNQLRPGWSETNGGTFLNEDFCAIEDRDFFVRGIIHLPIIGAAYWCCRDLSLGGMGFTKS